MDDTARELMRAIRGDQSQVAFSRALGYRGNPVAEWEQGRRAPDILEVLRAARRRRLDVDGAFAAFAPRLTHLVAHDSVAAWLTALRGASSNRAVAAHGGFSEHQVGRWMRGVAVPRLPEFLRLVEATTDRCSDWVAALVPIERVPSLLERHRARSRVRRLVFERPWTAAVLALLGVLQPHPEPVPAVAAALGLAPAEVAEIVDALLAAGTVARRDGAIEVVAPLTVDARPASDDLQRLRRHWAEVAAARLREPGPDDRFSYNVFNVAQEDLAAIRELQAGLYRQIRAIVARTRAKEVTALWIGHLLTWPVRAASPATPPADPP
ncbi:MAG: DUF4423 domain-containing protein [Myxococcota bacterium]